MPGGRLGRPKKTWKICVEKDQAALGVDEEATHGRFGDQSSNVKPYNEN